MRAVCDLHHIPACNETGRRVTMSAKNVGSAMTDSTFEYDVFISFASADQELVHPLWQDLTASGLRVFWSDSLLRDRVGTSWFDVIQQSLERSRHLLLVCTPSALGSSWVKREYGGFLSYCYRPPDRVLVPVLAAGSEVADLPLFLRELECGRLDDPALLRRLVRVFGGVDIHALRQQLAAREEEVLRLRNENRMYQQQIEELTQRVQEGEASDRDDTPSLPPAILPAGGPSPPDVVSATFMEQLLGGSPALTATVIGAGLTLLTIMVMIAG